MRGRRNFFLRDLIEKNPNIPFMIVEDEFNYKDSKDSDIIAKCGDELTPVQQTLHGGGS